ncbi:MAG TPA: adenylate/guanylate cyclase domain-containing protein [Actinomycetota bacterium]|nr:adenylate/guanylate cyclase domain-containing protein [Actinomycetota bacterium]
MTAASPRLQGTVTILVTDLVASTQLLSSLGDDRGEAVLRDNLRLMRTAVKEHGGHEVKSLGDGIMAAFSSAREAVDCAVAIRRRAADAEGSERLEVKMALHAGETTADEFDVYGTPVVIAARLCARAQPGEILVSDLLRHLVGSRGEYGFVSMGRADLKGIDDPILVWRIEDAIDPESHRGSRMMRLGVAIPGGFALILLMGAVLALATTDTASDGIGVSVGELVRVVDQRFGEEPNSHSYEPIISDGGNIVAFTSKASNLISADDNGVADVFVYNGSRIARVSVSSSGEEADRASSEPSISNGGDLVAFTSEASNLAVVFTDTNHVSDIYVHERPTGTTRRVSLGPASLEPNGDSFEPALSGDGTYIAYTSRASNLVGDDTNHNADVFLTEIATLSTIRVSHPLAGGVNDGGSAQPSISGDGRYVAFSSQATGLTTDIDENGQDDIFVFDRTTSSVELISTAVGGGAAHGRSSDPDISADGRYVVFVSEATDIVGGDDNDNTDVFLHDRTTGETILVSTAATGGGDHGSHAPDISADGSTLVFVSEASNLVAGDTKRSGFSAKDVFWFDVATTETTLVSRSRLGGANDASFEAAISPDGSFVAFTSKARNLVSDDTNRALDVFLFRIGATS